MEWGRGMNEKGQGKVIQNNPRPHPGFFHNPGSEAHCLKGGTKWRKIKGWLLLAARSWQGRICSPDRVAMQASVTPSTAFSVFQFLQLWFLAREAKFRSFGKRLLVWLRNVPLLRMAFKHVPPPFPHTLAGLYYFIMPTFLSSLWRISKACKHNQIVFQKSELRSVNSVFQSLPVMQMLEGRERCLFFKPDQWTLSSFRQVLSGSMKVVLPAWGTINFWGIMPVVMVRAVASSFCQWQWTFKHHGLWMLSPSLSL